MDDTARRIEELAVELTRIPSVVGTPGETDISSYLLDFIKSMPYFKMNPEKAFSVPIKGDSLGRFSVIAVIDPPEGSDGALLMISHTDTVGVSDFSGLKHLAYDPRKLSEALKAADLDEDAARDLASGDYIFGRGIFDMKAGLAAQVCLLSDLSQEPEMLEKSLVFAFLPDEEGGSLGMVAAAEAAASIAESRGMQYFAAIDTDYMTGRHPEDKTNYVYIGSVGKLLTAFYVHGSTSHVGEAFRGLDANLIASYIMRRIDLNPGLCDIAEGEVTQPPVSLRLKDTKQEYSVQTTGVCHLYFNFSTHVSEPDEVLAIMAGQAKFAMEEAVTEMSARYAEFLRASRLPKAELPFKARVMTYSELADAVDAQTGGRLNDIIREYCEGEGMDETDPRDFSLGLVRHVHKQLKDQGPIIVAFFSPPYYPHVYVSGADEKERALISAVESAAAEVRASFGYDIAIRKFYPYISDLSYCRLPESQGAIEALTRNMPAWGRCYSLPLEAISRIAAPVVNIGPYGKDAHKPTERLCRRYSLDAMPALLKGVVLNLAGCKSLKENI